MKKQYKQITSDERDLIADHYSNGFSLNEIANMLNRHKSTISRELTRNTPKYSHIYLSSHAHEKAKK
ncbi:MAG: IS30 family transposase, partial [Candidatus Omnitrophota bacterium]